MKKLFLFFLFIFSLNIQSQGLKTKGKLIVDKNDNEVLLRGYAPGGWLVMEGYIMQSAGLAGPQHEIREKLTELMGSDKTDEFFQKWRDNNFTKRDVDSLAAWGFNSIRIPMHYNLFTLPIQDEPESGKDTWLDTGFDIIDKVLEWSLPHNMYVILDLHAAPGGQGKNADISDYDDTKPSLWESDENKRKTVALWTKIAERYKDNEWIGGYDLINETNWPLGQANKDLKDLFVRITEGIRSTGDSHIIYIEGNDYANNFSGLVPPWDDNMAYSFHKYWSSVNADDLDWILPLQERYDVPLWMGESGENSNTWYTKSIELYENNNIGWNWWAMKKVGDIDSPYSIKINDGYQSILNYWKGEASKPTESETYEAMMKLADDALTENCLYRKGIQDALLRQPHTDDAIPYKEVQKIPGVVYLSDYDMGKNHIAYYDVDVMYNGGDFQAWNAGWQYRNDGVDVETNSDSVNSNGHHIGFVNNGEWIRYTVDVLYPGLYTMKLRFATQEDGGKFHFSMNDQDITTIRTENNTGGWYSFKNHVIENVYLNNGKNYLKIHFNDDVPLNVSSVEFERTGSEGSVEFNALSGKANDDEKSINVFLNLNISESSLQNSLDKFTVHINNEEKNISSISYDSDQTRTIKLVLENNIIYTDDVRVSYNGDLVKSTSGKALKSFTKLPIINNLNARFVLPGYVQVEDYYNMVGLGVENTSDTGGGKNIGYTHKGDYADYLIYSEKGQKYSVDFRVASNANGGKVGLFLGGSTYQIAEAELPGTGGWQEWTTVTVNLDRPIPQGISTLRMLILEEGEFNMNWMKFDYFDSDYDGVKDNIDQCPGTTPGVVVDTNGCEVFSMPKDNYRVEVGSATCIGNSDGVINLSVEDAAYDYTVTITGKDNVTITGTDKTASITGLSKGTYTVCFKVDGKDNYEQCFVVEVGEPAPLNAFIDVDEDNKRTSITMTGSKSYNVDVNGVKTTVNADTFETELNTGLNIIKVYTDLECQGYVEREVFISEDIHYYPNPTNNDVKVHVGGVDEKVTVSVYTSAGALVYTKEQDIADTSRKTQIDLSKQVTGTYIVVLDSKTVRKTFKIIRE